MLNYCLALVVATPAAKQAQVFCCLKLDRGALILSTYRPRGETRFVLARRETLAVGGGSGAKLDANEELSYAQFSPGKRWLAILADSTHPDGLRKRLLIYDMKARQSAFEVVEEGAWYPCRWIRWASENRLLVRHQNASAPWLEVDTYSGPAWRPVARAPAGRTMPDPAEILITPLEQKQRSGAVKLLHLFGYSTPYRRQGGGSLIDELHGGEGAIAADGQAIACVTKKVPRPWQMMPVHEDHDIFVLLDRTLQRPQIAGWAATTIALDLVNTASPKHVWFWDRFLIVHTVHNGASTLIFFRRRDGAQTVVVGADVFVEPSS